MNKSKLNSDPTSADCLQKISKFAQKEEKIQKFWEKEKIFEKSLKQREKSPVFSFYDGPPFATGLPHYGHLIPSLMKDVVPRYQTMKNRYVARRWGWDCHGLPIENLIEKDLKLKTKQDIENKAGVNLFCDSCQKSVLRYAEEWKKTILRFGRWVDMQKPYKTMDPEYMESIWWVFKTLWDKKLIYQGYKSMHICPRCETTLSNFEVTQEYKDIKDLSVIAKFELADEPGTYVLAWTTTPWTLIGNVALAVGKDIDYVKLIHRKSKKPAKKSELGEKYIIAKNIVWSALKNNTYLSKEIKEIFNLSYKNSWEQDLITFARDKNNFFKKYQIEIIKGNELVNKKYQQLFDYYKDIALENKKNIYTIQTADFVSTEEGTGVVHIAPAFGEDDMNLGQTKHLPFIQHVGLDGKFKKEVKDFAGLEVKPKGNPKETDEKIVKFLDKKNLVFKSEEYAHSYPHCWRCDSPLLNYATSSWFVKITEIKDKLIKNNEKVNWVPAHLKHGRFGKWLKEAKDWSISRSRFWGAPLPVWFCQTKKSKNNNCDNIIVVGSIAELEKLSGKKISDLHKPIVDKIEFKCPDCGGVMRRVPEVLDCWFESGSMPYAQFHYPFENQEKFEKSFPAEFIAEGLDQTRGWFYTLMVLATALFDKPAFKNVVVNGIVLAEDGKKLSKKFGNYSEPDKMFDKYSADAIRYYLLTSPLVKAEDLRFSEKDVVELLRNVFMLLENVLNFYKMVEAPGAQKAEPKTQNLKLTSQSNILDKWILAKLNELIKEVATQMDNYEFAKAATPFEKFINELSTWYLRRSRDRFKNGDELGITILGFTLLNLSKLMAPFTPFTAENLYQELKGELESVHLERFPNTDEKLIDKNILDQMERTRKIVELGLAARAEAGIKIRQPLQKLQITGYELQTDYTDLIKDELNIKEIEFNKSKELKIKLDTKITEELKLEGMTRELIRNINNLRRNKGLTIKDKVIIYHDGSLGLVFNKFSEDIKKSTLATEIKIGTAGDSVKINEQEVKLHIKKS